MRGQGHGTRQKEISWSDYVKINKHIPGGSVSKIRQNKRRRRGRRLCRDRVSSTSYLQTTYLPINVLGRGLMSEEEIERRVGIWTLQRESRMSPRLTPTAPHP